MLPGRPRRGVHVSSLRLAFRNVRADKHGNHCCIGYELAKQLQTLSSQHASDKHHAGDITTRTVEACNEAVPDRIASGGEDDGNCLGRDCRNGVCDYHGDWPTNQIEDSGNRS